MAIELGERKLGDLVREGALMIGDGYRVRNEELGSEGIPFVRGGDIHDGWIDTTPRDHIRPELADRVSAKLAVPGDVAFIAKGTVGRAGRLRPGQGPVVFSPQVSYWRVLDTLVLDPGFIYYLVRSRGFQATLDGVKSHGAMAADYVSISQQLDFRFRIPDIDSQRAVSRVLGALDDKIELNRRMNETLNAFCRTLFSRVTTGTVTAPLGDLVEINARKRDLTYPHDLIEYVEISGVSQGCIEEGKRHPTRLAPGRAQRLVRDGDTIWSCVRPNRRSYAFIDSPPDDLVVSTGFATLTPRRVPPAYLYFASTSDGFVDHLTANADGSAYPAVKPEHFAMGEIPLASDEEIGAFEAVVRPALARAAHNERESRTLAALRDSLLPKLISGELRIRDANDGNQEAT